MLLPLSTVTISHCLPPLPSSLLLVSVLLLLFYSQLPLLLLLFIPTIISASITPPLLHQNPWYNGWNLIKGKHHIQIVSAISNRQSKYLIYMQWTSITVRLMTLLSIIHSAGDWLYVCHISRQSTSDKQPFSIFYYCYCYCILIFCQNGVDYH